MLAGLLLWLLAGVAHTYDQDWADGHLEDVRQHWGQAAEDRMKAWLSVMGSGRSLPEAEKLRRANDFWNRVPYGDDIQVWGREEYWATPVEFLASNAGDCEDYAVAKYYTLRSMGVPESRLRLIYVVAYLGPQRKAIHHMVLGYYASPDADPLVLDNIDRSIRPASQRTNLSPIYAFNGDGLWDAMERGGSSRMGGGDAVDKWRDLRGRIVREGGH